MGVGLIFVSRELFFFFFILSLLGFLPDPSSAVTEALMAPAQYPDCSGTRNLHDNLSDLRAQVAANQRGSQLVGELIDCYGLAVVQAYMGYIQVQYKISESLKAKMCPSSLTPLRPSLLVPQSNAELAVRDMLRDFARRTRRQADSLEVESEDYMDDGTPIRLRVQINEKEVKSSEKKTLLKVKRALNVIDCVTTGERCV